MISSYAVIAIVAISAFVALGSIKRIIVETSTVALLYRNGVFERELPPGRHFVFDPLRSSRTTVVPMVAMALFPHEVSVISRDQFSFRVGLTPIARVVNARAYHEAQSPGESGGWPQQSLILSLLAPTLGASVLDLVSARSLDEFMTDPRADLSAIRDVLNIATPGVEIIDLLLTSVTVPPEVRKMFTEVERAKREGLAALERARAEQASLRALANAARALNNNPQLAHLRMLQMVETTKGPKTIVLGNLNGQQLPSDGTTHFSDAD
jgi:regulator of protease activity HflC (stomatin/prohibitin superfamily)